VGQVDEWHAPGVLIKTGETRAAVDCAWLVERVLGAPRRRPEIWPGVPGAREAAMRYQVPGPMQPAVFQREGAAFLAERDYAILTDEMGCVEGDAIIHVNRAGRGMRLELRDLYQGFHRWDRGIETKVRVNADGSLRQHAIVDVLFKGVRDVVALTLKSGKTVRLTPDHEVALPDGNYRAVGQLAAGDAVLSNGRAICLHCGEDKEVVTRPTAKFPGYCRKCIYRVLRHNAKLKNGKFIDKDGYVRVTAGHRDHPRHTTGGVYEHILVMEKHLGRYLSLAEEVHHRNGIRHENELSNLVLLTGTEHAARHGREGGFRRLHGGRTVNGGVVEFVPVVDEVVSVEPAGSTDVYDIVCADPHRNFVANGVVVHNCGKTPQALIAAEARLSLGHVPGAHTPAVLVLCPAIAKQHWANEIRKWTGHESAILDSLTPDPDAINERYVVCNYDILYAGRQADAAGVVHEVRHLPGWAPMLTGRFLIAILDEVHILRGRTSRRAKTVKSMLNRVTCVWGLSGTPMPNYVRDLYSVVDIVSDGLFGMSYWKWAQAYCGAYQGQYGWVDTGASRIDELNGRLTFFMLGRSAKTVKLELPEKRREIFRVDVRASAPSVAEGNKALNKQNAVGAALRYTARAKRGAVVEQAVEALRAKQKVVVFVYMREQADAIAKDIRKHVDCNVMAVSGDLPADGRFAQAQMFRESTAPAAFVATIDSMTVSLSLVGANLVIFGDLVHEPWKLLQAEKRCHRFDSVERVLVRYMIANGTIDDAMVTNVIEKIPVIEQTVGSTEDAGELTKMLGGKSQEEILDSLFQSLLAPKESDA
jgi:hypothetical protein